MSNNIMSRHVAPDNHLGIDLCTDKIINANIAMNGIKEVTNPINFDRGGIPTVDGLFSEYIFGVTTDERRLTWAYIDLGCKVIHPYIFYVLGSIQQNIKDVCEGKGSWKVTDEGDLVPIKENDDSYDVEKTGIDWFVKNYKKIKFKKNDSRERNEKIDLLNTLGPDDIFISKWLVIPVFYRDLETKDGPLKIPPINKEYTNLIRYSQSVKYESLEMDMMTNLTKYNIQSTLCAIQTYYQEIIQKSDGFFKQYVLGKNPDYGVRSVISCPVLTEYDTPDDMPIDMNTTGFPLSEVLSMLFPFVQRWIYNWFLNFTETIGNIYSIEDSGKTARIIDGASKYTPDYIAKKISSWIDNYESRFELITFDMEYEKNGKLEVGEWPIKFFGIPYSNDPNNPNVSQICDRYMTWTDIFYIAAVECSEDKYAWVTRYPLTSYLGTFPTKIFVLSTTHTSPCQMDINGEIKIYKYYPIIDLNKSSLEVSTSFNETVNMPNSILDSIGGDYDGDTISAKAVYSIEANQEVNRILYEPTHFLRNSGNLVASMTNEGILTLYNMTRD
jgi:hypothetical protein